MITPPQDTASLSLGGRRSPSFASAILCAVIPLGCLSLAFGDDRSFLNPPEHVGPPRDEQAVTNRAFQGISSLAQTSKGRLWAVWYAGVTPNEDDNNYCVVATSADQGKTWNEVLVIDPDGSGRVRAFDPEVWMGPDGRLRVFWAQTIRHDGRISGTWMIETEDPDSANPKWSAPRRLCDGIMMCKPTVLANGEWVLPISTWRETDDSAKIVVSSNQGRTWSVRGAVNVPKEDRNFDEHMIVERKDGSLWMWVRTKYGIAESISKNGGKTWSDLQPSPIKHTASRFFVSRLASGNLLLVKHGLIDEDPGRSKLMAFVSKDDGKTWDGGLMLDERRGISYPDGQQGADGMIHITYDFNRTRDREVLMASFREEDVLAGKPITPDAAFRRLIAKASGGETRDESLAPVDLNSSGAPLQKLPAGEWVESSRGAEAIPFEVGQKIFGDRDYVIAEAPDSLRGASFLRLPIEGRRQLTVEQAGYVYLLTPSEGKLCSAARKLESDGFEKVLLPEIRLFEPHDANNCCTLYQKRLDAGESYQIGKWAVPVFFSKAN